MKLQHYVRYSQFIRVYIFTWRVLLLPRFVLNSYFTTLAHHRGPRQRCTILGRHVSILCVHALGRACRLVEHIYNIRLTEDDNTVFYNLKRFHQQLRDVYIWQRVELVYTILPFFLYVQFNLKQQSSLPLPRRNSVLITLWFKHQVSECLSWKFFFFFIFI